MYLIKEVAQLTGISVRSLHHYDKLGLLVPAKAENGYRYYSESDLDTLQSILFYKYLGFPLKKIAELLKVEQSERFSLLEHQLCLLEEEEKRLQTLIDTLKKTIQTHKGERNMTTQEKFTGFTYQDHQVYREQAIGAYGKEVIEESKRHQQGKEEQLVDQFNHVFQTLAQTMSDHFPVDDSKVQKQVDELYHLFNTYAFDCSLEVFASIGRGYVANADFQKNIDQFAAGLAQYTCDAIQVYVEKNS